MGKIDTTHQQQLFNTQLGQSAEVSREKIKGDKSAECNKRLREIGALANPLPDNLGYKGSIAVHVYYNETLKQGFFVSQPLVRGVQEDLGMAATKDLIGATMEAYGYKRPRKRSGF